MKNSQNQHARRSQQRSPPSSVPATGNPVQQLWQIANFHERRLNRVERAHVENAATLAQQLQASREQEGDGATQSVANELKKLASRIARLEASVVKPKAGGKKKKNTVSLEVTEGGD